MLSIEEIIEVRKANGRSGYEIVFPGNRLIWILKRRAIVGLLLLIKYEKCSEADLAGANDRLSTVKKVMDGKIDASWILSRYSDANKPFSELWTEEGFSCVRAEGMRGNRQYVLNPADHHRLFQANAKAIRIALTDEQRNAILCAQEFTCNICGSLLKQRSDISTHTFSKDRVRMEIDHRVPVDRGGSNSDSNLQALCHYCNKSKRQMCFICLHLQCSEECALVRPESRDYVVATSECIRDRITRRKRY